MKNAISAIRIFIFSIFFTIQVDAQFINGQNAAVVLGQPDFTSNTAATTSSGFKAPRGILIDPATGKVFVAEQDNNRVLRFSSSASLTNGSSAEAVLGQLDFSSSSAATSSSGMNQPIGLAMDGAGNLWVADRDNSRVLMFANGATVSSGASANLVLGKADFNTLGDETTQNGMNRPTSVAIDQFGNLYVGDAHNFRVLRFNSAASLSNGSAADAVFGQTDFVSGSSANTQSKFSDVAGLALDKNDNLFVSEFGTSTTGNRILRFANASTAGNGENAASVIGQPDFVSGSQGTTVNSFNTVAGIATDKNGNLFVADALNHRVLFFDQPLVTNPDAVSVLGQTDFTTGTSGLSQNKMSAPIGVSIDSSNHLYVAEYFNNRVLKFDLQDALPVELSEFRCINYGLENHLTWKTKSETNNYGWQIYLKDFNDNNSSNWKNIGFVTGKGTTVDPQSYSFKLPSLNGNIQIRLKQIDLDGTFSYSKILTVDNQPSVFILNQNFPNPFNPSTEIQYQLKTVSYINLTVYDILGKEVEVLVDKNMQPGIYKVSFNAKNLTSGIYFYKFKAGNFTEIKQMVLIK